MTKKNYFPEDWEDFVDYMDEIENQQHDYSSIADALTDTTVAFFNYYASKHGMTGFQAGYSGMQVIGKLRGMKHPFMILDSSKLLYPQYDLANDVQKFLDESKVSLAPVAKEMIAELDEDSFVSKGVVARWKEIASLEKS